MKKKDVIILGMICLISIAGIWVWDFLVQDETISVPIQKDIEKIAENQGISVIEVQAIKEKGFEIVVNDANSFFELLKEPKMVFVTNEITTDERMRPLLIRKYWAFANNTAITFSQEYFGPEFYRVKEITDNEIVFQRDFLKCVVANAELTALLIIAYVVIIYPWIKELKKRKHEKERDKKIA